MSAQDTLSRIVEREAGKLDRLSDDDDAPLAAENLEALEVLTRCAKYLRAPTSPPKDDLPGEPQPGDIEKVA